MSSSLLRNSAKALFSKLQPYTGSSWAQGGQKEAVQGFSLSGLGHIRNADGSGLSDPGSVHDDLLDLRDVPMSHLSWEIQMRILSRKLTRGAEIPSAASRFLTSQLGESTLLYNKASTLGSNLLYLLAAPHKALETVDINDVYQVFEEYADSVSPIYFDILEYIGLCLDSRRLRNQQTNEGIFSPSMPLLYVTRKFEKAILGYIPMNSPLFEKIDDILDQCEGRIAYDRSYWRSYNVISYVSQFVMYALINTAVQEHGIENLSSDNLYHSGVMTDNCEPLYPMLYILFRMGQYDALHLLIERYSAGIPKIVVSLYSAFWRLYQGVQHGNMEEVEVATKALRSLEASGAYTSLLSSTTSANADLFLLDFLSFFKPYSRESLLDSLQHVIPGSNKDFACVFEFSNLFHLTVSMLLYPDTNAEELCITIDDVNFQLTSTNMVPIRSLIAFHNVLTGNFYNAIYVLAEETDLLPEAVGLFFLLAIVCRSYRLVAASFGASTTKDVFVMPEDTLEAFFSIRGIYDMPFCQLDTKRLESFANPRCLDTTTAAGIGSILLAFLLCHCPHSTFTEVAWISRILPLNAQLVLLAVAMSFLPSNEDIVSYKYFSSEIYPLFHNSIWTGILNDTVLATYLMGNPAKLHRLLIFLLAGAYELRGDVRLAFEHYKDSMTHGNALQLAYACATSLLGGGTIFDPKEHLPLLSSAFKLRMLYQTNENMRSVFLKDLFGEAFLPVPRKDPQAGTSIVVPASSPSMYYSYRHVWLVLTLLNAKLLLQDTGDLAEVVRLCNDESGLRALALNNGPFDPNLELEASTIISFLLDVYSCCRMAGYNSITSELVALQELCKKAHVDAHLSDLVAQMCATYVK